MKEREVSVCIWIHHIATFAGISEGMYYLITRKQNLCRRGGIFLLTIFQIWAGFRILDGLRRGRSDLRKICENLECSESSLEEKRGILWTVTFLSAAFKLLPVHILGQ